MDVSTTPKSFSDDIYKALEDFNKLLFFRWDVSTDTIEFSTEMNTVPYSLPEKADYISNSLLLYGLLNPADVVLFENFLNRIFTGPAEDHKNPERTEAEVRFWAANKED